MGMESVWGQREEEEHGMAAAAAAAAARLNSGCQGCLRGNCSRSQSRERIEYCSPRVVPPPFWATVQYEGGGITSADRSRNRPPCTHCLRRTHAYLECRRRSEKGEASSSSSSPLCLCVSYPSFASSDDDDDETDGTDGCRKTVHNRSILFTRPFSYHLERRKKEKRSCRRLFYGLFGPSSEGCYTHSLLFLLLLLLLLVILHVSLFSPFLSPLSKTCLG